MKKLALLPLLFVFACGGENPPAVTPVPPPPAPTPVTLPPPVPTETPDADFRKKPPAPDGKVTFVAPKIAEAKLKNGLRVLIVERHDLPIVAVRLAIVEGAGDVPDAKPGAMSFLGAMLEQGTKKRTALQIDDDFEALGASHGAWFDWDSGGVAIKVLADKLDAALEVMSDVALHPTFPDAEIDRLRTRRIAGIQSEKSSPGAIAQNTVAPVVFGRAHPYGHTLSGEESDVKKITKADLQHAYDKLFVPENAAIVVAGDVTQATLLPKLENAFGAWKGKGGKPLAADKRGPKTPTKTAADKKIVVVDRPGAQSQIQLVRVGVPFATKDRDAIVVMNAILGGMFSSRVNLNLREKHAYTYGARSYFFMRHGAGAFQVGAPVVAAATVPSIKEVIAELKGLEDGGATDEELTLAKENILQAMPGRFESVSDVANAVTDLVVYDLPLDYFDQRRARIEAITGADVKKVAGELLDPKNMTVVVVGDKNKLSAELDSLGLGPTEERDPYGNPVKPGAKPPETTPAPKK